MHARQALKEAEAILREQEAYGKWNTAAQANRVHEMHLALMPPWRRALHKIVGKIGLAVVFALSYGLPVYIVAKIVVGY